MTNLFSINCVVTGILSALFGLFVLLCRHSEGQKSTARAWAAACFSVGVWSFGLGMMTASRTQPEADFWIKVHYVGATLIPTVFLHFTLKLLNQDAAAKRLLGWAYALTAVFLALNLTGRLAIPKPTPPFRFYTTPGQLYNAYSLYFALAVCYAHLLLFRELRATKGNRHAQIQYLIVGMGIGFIGGSTAFLPVYHIRVFPGGVYLVFVYIILVGYAILKHRLMDLTLLARDATRKILCWSMLGTPILVGTTLAHFLMNRPGFLFSRGPGEFICTVLNYSLALALLRNYGEPPSDRLRRFFTVLGTWELTTLILTAPPSWWSLHGFRLSYFCGAFVLLLWFQFWESFFGNQERAFTRFLRISLYVSVPIMAAIAAFSPRIVLGLQFDPSEYLPATEIPGPWFPLFGGWFMVVLVLIGAWMAGSLKTSAAEKRRPDESWVWVCFGSAMAAAGAYFLFVTHRLGWFFYAPMEAVLCLSLMRVLSGRSKVGVRLDAAPVSLEFGAMTIGLPFAAGVMLALSPPVRVAGALLVAIFAQKILNEIEKSVTALVDHYLFREKFSYLAEIERIGNDMFQWINLPELLKHLVRDLTARARLSWVGVWLFDITAGAYDLQQASGYERDEDLPGQIGSASFGPASALVRSFERTRKLLVTEDLVRSDRPAEGPAGTEDSQAATELTSWGIAAALPMYSGEKLIGFIGFGPKRQQEPFHQADIDGLSDLGKKAQRAIAQAYVLYQQAKMLTKLAHDLLNFINPQTLAIQELASRCGPVSPDQKKHLKTIWSQKELIEESIRDLLELERLVELRMEGKWRMKLYQLEELVQASIGAYQAKANGKGVRVEGIFNGCPDGIGDPRSIRRIIDNLLINALKFTPRDGRISLEVQTAGTNLRLIVSDSGAGIPPQELPRIFDPFYQGSNHPGLVQGTGIGLSNVKEFVSLHKGLLRVDSKLGQGTTFVIELPSIRRRPEFDESMLEVQAAI